MLQNTLKDVSLDTPQRPNTDPHKVWLEEYFGGSGPMTCK